MKTARLFLPREWWRFGLLLVAQIHIALQLTRYGREDMTMRVIGIAVLAFASLALVDVLKRVTLEFLWSDERIEVRRGKRILIDCAWTEGVIVQEDLRNFLIYPPSRGRAVTIPKSVVPPELRAILTQRLAGVID